MPSVPKTHPAVGLMGLRKPLGMFERPTVLPQAGEVVVLVEWTASTPFDLHQADGGLLIDSYPRTMGDSFAGTVVQRGPPPPDSSPAYTTADIQVGEKVFGFVFQKDEQKAHQTYITVATYLLGRVPQNISMQEAAAVPNNLITALHTITTDLGLPLPWPLPERWSPPAELKDAPILVWGSGSSVGLYAIQALRHWRYSNILAVASEKHHAALKALGAAAAFDYRQADATEKILSHVGTASGGSPRIPFILDCIGSIEGTLRPLTRIADAGARVAIMLPLIVKDATRDTAPEYEMDVRKYHKDLWKPAVELRGVRTHHYLENEFFKWHAQPDIMPQLLGQGVVEANKQRVIQGKTMLQRAQTALDLLREKAVSGEKMVWRVAEDELIAEGNRPNQAGE